VKIAGVLHEYSTIDGVQEDVVDILLNLKGVVIKLHNRDEATLTLRKRAGRRHGRRHRADARRRDHQSRARDRAPHQGGKLDMQIKVEKGRGYVPATHAPPPDERPHDRPHDAGRLVLAGAPRELRGRSARVEQRTDLDKLVIDIETNGAIDAEEACATAADILVDQLSVFATARRHRDAASPPSEAAARRRSTRSCCARSTTSSSRCVRPTASRPRTSTTSAT
jgi:DNA-directed RNA polymerase subunit alpha